MRFAGKLGFVVSVETKPGVYVDKVIERQYKGNILRDYRKWDAGESLNDNISINNTISVVADVYIRKNLQNLKFIVWNDVCWKVSSIDIKFPRIEIYLGGVYNGPRIEEDSTPNNI